MFVSSNLARFNTLIGQSAIKNTPHKCSINLSTAVLTLTFALSLNPCSALRNHKVPSAPCIPSVLVTSLVFSWSSLGAYKFPYSKTGEVFGGQPCSIGVRKSLTLEIQNFTPHSAPRQRQILSLEIPVRILCNDSFLSKGIKEGNNTRSLTHLPWAFK